MSERIRRANTKLRKRADEIQKSFEHRKKMKCPHDYCRGKLIQKQYDLWSCNQCGSEWNSDELGLRAEEHP